MGSAVEGIIAGLGLAAGMMVRLIALLFGETTNGERLNESHHRPHTIRHPKGRMVA